MIRYLTLIGIGLWILCSVWAEELPAIIIPDEVTVSNNQFTLGDIAAICADAELMNKMAEINLGMSPRFGLKRLYTRAQIIQRLKQNHFDPAQFNLQIPVEFTIFRDGQTPESNLLVETAREKLRVKFGSDADEFTLVSEPKTVAVKPGEYKTAVDGEIRTNGKLHYITVKIIQNDVATGSYVLSFRDERKAPEKIIKSGDPIVLELVCGGLKITVTAEARESGAIGDMISVYIPATKKTVQAEIVNEKKVRLTESEA